MRPLHRVSLYLWLLLRHLPPVSPGWLVMPVVFVSSWTVLLACHVPQPLAFVWAGVLAQAAQIWATLPVTIWRQRHTFGTARPAVPTAMVMILSVLALQIWWAGPVISQRMVSAYCGLYVLFLASGLRGDRDILNRFTPVDHDTQVPLAFRQHLLRLYILIAMLVLGINETLLAIDAPLGARVATFALMPVVLHYMFEIMLRLTCPPLDEMDS
jgi:hypothetical protein